MVAQHCMCSLEHAWCISLPLVEPWVPILLARNCQIGMPMRITRAIRICMYAFGITACELIHHTRAWDGLRWDDCAEGGRQRATYNFTQFVRVFECSSVWSAICLPFNLGQNIRLIIMNIVMVDMTVLMYFSIISLWLIQLHIWSVLCEDHSLYVGTAVCSTSTSTIHQSYLQRVVGGYAVRRMEEYTKQTCQTNSHNGRSNHVINRLTPKLMRVNVNPLCYLICLLNSNYIIWVFSWGSIQQQQLLWQLL